MKILLVEDDKLVATVTQARLEQVGYQVALAYTGEEALERYTEGYDLILMDLGLPDMTGFEVSRAIRQGEGKKRHTSIIALTIKGAAEAGAACMNAGMDGFMTKPLDVTRLAAIVKKLEGGIH